MALQLEKYTLSSFLNPPKASQQPLSSDEETPPPREEKKRKRKNKDEEEQSNILEKNEKKKKIKNELSSDEEEEQQSKGQQKKLKKRNKKLLLKAAADREKKISLVEKTRLDDAAGPLDVFGFEELVQANPECSISWIRFVTFYLGDHKIEEARKTIRRALQKISLGKQDERLQIWTVYFRMEVMHNSGRPVLEELIREACGNVDDFKFLQNVANIYKENGMEQEAEAVLKKLTKKFYAVGEVWEALGLFYYECQRLKEARDVLGKAVKLLKKKDGVDLTCKFGVFEFRHGCPTQATQIFFHLTTNAPKRIDVWNVYVDQLIKAGLADKAREVLLSMCSGMFPLKQTSKVFQKAIAFEKKHGTDATLARMTQQLQKFADQREQTINE